MSPLGTIVEEHDHSGPLKGGGDLRPQGITCRRFRLATAPTAGYALLADAAGVGTWQDIASAVPGIDLAAYFKLAGRAGGQGSVAYGGTGATDVLDFAGNSTSTPGAVSIKTRNDTSSGAVMFQIVSLDGNKTPFYVQNNGATSLVDFQSHTDGITLMLDVASKATGFATGNTTIARFRRDNALATTNVVARITIDGAFVSNSNNSAALGPAASGVAYAGYVASGTTTAGPAFVTGHSLNIDMSALSADRILTVQNIAGTVAVCNSVPAGSIIYGTSTGIGFTALANGTVGQVLTSGGTTAPPTWATPSGGGGSTFLDNVFRVQDDGDNTKQLALQVSGVTTATTRTWTVQDADGTVPLLERAETWSAIQTFGTAQRFSSDGTTADVMLLENSGGWDLLKCSKKATSWVDADAITTQFQIGDVSTTRHAVITGQGTTGSVFDRLGISSTYTLFSSGLHTVFPLKTANNEIFRVYQGSSDALEVCRIEIDRASGTGHILRLVSGRASTVDTIWNARNVMLQGRIKTDVLFTDDNATIASAKLLGLSTTSISAGATRTWTAQDLDGTVALLQSPQTFTVTQTYNAPLALNEVSTPAAPAQNTGTLFTRQSPTDASNIQLCFIASSGAVCVICDLLDVNHVNTMLFNGIE
jgi:hypothetical protein